MSSPFVAEIRIFAGNFAPTGWALCDGQLLPISQNTALFSLLGTYYGGDGKSTFALPNMQGNAPMHWGDGPGLTGRFIGEASGTQYVTLLSTETPSHPHQMQATEFGADLKIPDPTRVLATSTGANAYQSNASQNLVPLSSNAVSISGADQPHNNMQPFLTLTFIIALQGVYPPRT
jgi:microcystin-dependent protein